MKPNKNCVIHVNLRGGRYENLSANKQDKILTKFAKVVAKATKVKTVATLGEVRSETIYLQ
jgi:hypothetical protein